jgi:hypothetical protein
MESGLVTKEAPLPWGLADNSLVAEERTMHKSKKMYNVNYLK